MMYKGGRKINSTAVQAILNDRSLAPTQVCTSNKYNHTLFTNLIEHIFRVIIRAQRKLPRNVHGRSPSRNQNWCLEIGAYAPDPDAVCKPKGSITGSNYGCEVCLRHNITSHLK